MTNILCQYERPIFVRINNISSAVLFRFVQLIIIAYIVYSIYRTEGWNETERGIYSTYTNVEGYNFVKSGHVWDSIDFLRPPQEKDSFFIPTKVLITEQQQGFCVDNDENNQCLSDWDCLNRTDKTDINTGQCDKAKRRCKIRGWCPRPDTSLATTITHRYRNAEHFTVYVRNNVEFVRLKQFRSNDEDFENNRTCQYDPVASPVCPIFKIETILSQSSISYEDIMEKGAVISFFIKWDCYFNGNHKPCAVKYEFRRTAIDNKGQFKGCKYRYANYHTSHSNHTRTLMMVYGLRFLIMVISQGRQFNFLELLQNIGSLLCYLGAWTTVSTLTFVWLLNQRQRRLCVKEESTEKESISFIEQSQRVPMKE